LYTCFSLVIFSRGFPVLFASKRNNGVGRKVFSISGLNQDENLDDSIFHLWPIFTRISTEA
jgi:hypothetical protein